MTDTLTARLLAEIERRTAVTHSVPRNIVARNQILALMQGNLAYLAALRKIVERHRVYLVSGDRLPICAHCDRRYPCVELMDVATALDVTP